MVTDAFNVSSIFFFFYLFREEILLDDDRLLEIPTCVNDSSDWKRTMKLTNHICLLIFEKHPAHVLIKFAIYSEHVLFIISSLSSVQMMFCKLMYKYR